MPMTKILENLQWIIALAAVNSRRDSISKRQSRDVSKPAAAWLAPTRMSNQTGIALSIVLRTIGCSHARKESGGCTMCSYLLDGTNQPVTSEQLVNQFQHGYAKLSNETAPISVKLYTSGSLFDPDEVPFEARREIFGIIARDTRVHEVVLESRPEYITDESISETRRELGDRQVEIGIGLESSNDDIRIICVNKGFAKSEFQKALLTAQVHDIGIRAYILVKPPFLTERDAIIDASKSIIDAAEMGVNTISLNPVNVQKYTLVEKLWRRGDYRPPWLWSVVEILKRSRQEIKKSINIICDPVGGGKRRGAHNCRACDENVIQAIREFSLTQNVDVLGNLTCDCFATWMHVLEHEDFSLLVHSDQQF